MKNILIPTDFSENHRNVLKYAVSLGLKSNDKLIFQYVSAKVMQDIENYAAKIVNDIIIELKENPKDISMEFLFAEDIFSNSLIKETAEKNKVCLVIMGADKDGMKNTFYGSHLSGLIDELNCPVISIPFGYNELNIDRIGYATELEDLTEKIKEIIPFAKRLSASIEAFYVYPVFPQEMDLEKYDLKNSLELLHKENEYDKINIHFVKTSHDNELVKGIHEFIKTYKPDLLVMCHKPRGWFDKLLLLDSGATPSVVKDCPIPVLALKKGSACRIM